MGVVLELQPEDVHRRYDCEDNSNAAIGRHVYGGLDYSDFYWRYLHANWPVVFTDTANDWECHLQWTLKTVGGTTSGDLERDKNTNTTTTTTTTTQCAQMLSVVNVDYLRRQLGDCRVPVADCSKEYYNSHAKCEMNFRDYLDYWQAKCQQLSNSTATTATMESLYLKDWHLKAQMPDYSFYTVPKYFASDWLNEYLIDSGRDDYRFVYMGPKDSWTPLHVDVFGSYSWSTNVLGSKIWILLPPGEELPLKDTLGNLPLRLTEQMLQDRNVRYYVVHQQERESMFVPSGWHHQVHNVTDSISVNHNWFNACNVVQIWRNLAAGMRQVVSEIEDCRQMDNFEDHCHTMLRATFGINFFDFVDLLDHIADKRISLCANNNNNDESATDAAVEGGSHAHLLFDIYTLSNNHARHDLRSIHKVAKEMLQNYVVCDSRTVLYRRCMHLQQRTETF